MRLPEAKIKAAILHPEKLARQEAVSYFSNCFSPDAEVMPLAIQAIEEYGRREAFRYIHQLVDLVQTEATVEWLIRELHREGETPDQSSFCSSLSRILCNADPRLLVPRAQEILKAPGFAEDLTVDFQERLDLLSWDADRCWNELEEICQRAVQTKDSEELDFEHANRVVSALARQGEPYADRILELLGRKVTDFENDPMSWLEIFLVDLAGQMRLEQAGPLIVAKLHEIGEILSESCIDALGMIATDEAVEAVTEGWLATQWDYRLYASSALEKIHSDVTVRKCLELLPQDPDDSIRANLAAALLSQFAFEGVEPVRQMVERQEYDRSLVDLRENLVAVSTILEVAFPELPAWKREVEIKAAETDRPVREMDDWFQKPAPAAPVVSRPREVYKERQPATTFVHQEKKVGRNDPCPCGSGKKFKNCCMKKT